MRVAIVTGASSGIGEEFCRQLDRRGLDSLWIIARRADRLEMLAEELVTPCHIIPADLTEQNDLVKINTEILESDVEIEFLVNCAGFGKFGNTWEIPADKTKGMIDLNITALVMMTNACIPFMHEGSRIIQLCSASAYVPLYKLNVYASTKAFVKSFCGGLRRELKESGITVTEVSPGWVGTDFIELSRTTDEVPEKVFAHLLKKEDVVSKALRDSEKGRGRSTPGFFYRFQIALSTHFPNLVSAIWESYFRK